MDWDGKERRRKKRYGVKNLHARYKKGGAISLLHGFSGRYLILNVSEQGMHMITSEALKIGAPLVMILESDKVDVPIHARARVIWSVKSDTFNAYRVGMEITKLEGRSRSLLKHLLDNAVLGRIDISTRIYLKELEKL